MLIRLLPLLLAIPLSLAAALVTPAVQRVLLPPPEGIRELTEVARSRPEPAPPMRRDVEYHRDLLRRYRLDVYGPLPGPPTERSGEAGASARVSAPAPVIVFFHGGSWVRGDKITLLVVDRFLRRMRREGWFVVSVDYTTSALRGIGGPVRNAYRAVEWVHDHADDYGWDRRRVGLYGVSSGAHLALMAASPRAVDHTGAAAESPGMPEDPRPVLVLAECAPVDLIAMREGDAFENSGTFALFPEFRLQALSPVKHIDADYPPVLVYHGDADQTVHFDQAEILSNALTATDVSHDLVRYPGGNHAFLNYSDDQWYEQESRALRWMRAVFADGTPPPPDPPPSELPLFTRRSDSP